MCSSGKSNTQEEVDRLSSSFLRLQTELDALVSTRMQEIEQHPTTFRIQTFCFDEASMSPHKFPKNRVVHSKEEVGHSELSQLVVVQSGNAANSEEHAFLFRLQFVKDYIV